MVTATAQQELRPTLALGMGLMRSWCMHHGAGSSPEAGVVPRVLAARGLLEGADAFLDPKLTQLIEPALMPDMDRAAQRLLRAARDGERVVIYGDYDVDGVTSTAILLRTLRAIAPGADVRTYVPHRLEEGYGLNAKAIASLAGEGARVIVTVDCGITAHAPAMVAQQHGVDLIITDHHNPPERMEDLPPAYAVVHPRRPDSVYPFGDLSGAGVAYKLAWRMAALDGVGGRARPELRALLVELLAFAALGAIADVVPLVGENRVIAAHGLARVRHSPFAGLRALVEASGLAGEKIGEYDAGFRLAPRLNACGRLGHAKDAVELFCTDDAAKAARIARQLDEVNIQRRAAEHAIVAEATQRAIDAGMTGDDARAIVLADPGWHAGVVGICCSRLVDRFARPALLLHTDPATGESHGSGRSIDAYNLHAGLHACAQHLVSYGGHDMAAGLRVRSGALEAFTRDFVAHATARIAPEQMVHRLEIDTHAQPGELSLGVVRRLLALRPFGRGNPAVRILLRGVRLLEQPRAFGAHGAHLELTVGDDHARLRITAWRLGQLRTDEPERFAGALARGVPVEVVIEPKIDTYGHEKPAGELVDLRAAT
jgi:single-stranded-DNA-specific exonuclease